MVFISLICSREQKTGVTWQIVFKSLKSESTKLWLVNKVMDKVNDSTIMTFDLNLRPFC